MKKTYIAPTTKKVTDYMDTLLNAASSLNGQEGNDNVSVGFSGSEYDGEGAANKSGSFWDEED